MAEPKFKIGDQVRVVNYGHHIRGIKNGLIEKIDINPEVVGKVGTVSVVSSGNQYAVEGIPGKHAWYNEDQLELTTSTFQVGDDIYRKDTGDYVGTIGSITNTPEPKRTWSQKLFNSLRKKL